MAKVYKLTLKEREELEEERRVLKEIDIPEAKRILIDAKSHGDFRENDCYDTAVSLLKTHEDRLEKVEDKLCKCEIIKEDFSNTSIIYGSTISFRLDGVSMRKKLTESSSETNFFDTISSDSILGEKMLGHCIGDIFVYSDVNGVPHEVSIESIL